MDEEKQNDESAHALALQQVRRQEEARAAQQEVASSFNPAKIAELEALVANKDKVVQFVMMGMLTGGNDVLDFFGIGAIPLVGDVVDLGTGAGVSALSLSFAGHPRWKAQAIIWGATFFELIPLGVNDLVPTGTVGVIVMYTIIIGAGRKAEEKLAEMGHTT
ncbi:MAG: hypothetical protein AAB581_04340 [Patescibacteria group bacterium]